MTRSPSTRALRGVPVALLVAWLVLIVENGVWAVVGAAVNPQFAPEIGPVGSFVVISLIHSAYFVPLFLLVACPFLWLVRRRSRTGRWLVASVAVLLVAATSVVVSAAWLHDSRRDTEWIATLSALPAGIGAAVVLRSWYGSAAPAEHTA